MEALLKTDMASARRELFDATGLFVPFRNEIRLHSQADDLPWHARQLAGLAFEIQVVEPMKLRHTIRDVATLLQKLVGWNQNSQVD